MLAPDSLSKCKVLFGVTPYNNVTPYIMDHINLVISSDNYVWKGDMIRVSSAVKQSIIPTDPKNVTSCYQV